VVDPYIPAGEVPEVEHVVPPLGIAIVPVEEVGTGLTPGDAISVAPSGIPVGETAEPVAMPRGEVASMVAVGVAVAPTCAIATLLTKSAGRTAAINKSFVGIRRFAMVSLGVGLSDIGLSPSGGKRSFVIICSRRDVQCSISYAAACSKIFRTRLISARWRARPVCTIKYDFIFLVPIESCPVESRTIHES
jgi:hypothetical protein